MTNQSSSRRHGKRFGISLIETGAAIAIIAVLSGVVVSGIVAILKYNRSTNRHWDAQTAMQQMMTTIRTDIHQATSLRWDADDQSVRLELPEQQHIEYRRLDSRWVRRATFEGAGPVTTSFGLNSEFRCTCRATNVEQGKLARLRFTNKPVAAEPAHRTAPCDATSLSLLGATTIYCTIDLQSLYRDVPRVL